MLDHEKVKSTIHKVANKNSVRPDILREMLDQFFIDLRKQLESEEAPNILIRNFGRFKPTRGRINKQILYLNRKLTNSEGEAREKIIEKIDRLMIIKERIENEKHTRNE